MKFFKFGIIGFIILNYTALGCAKAPSQFSDIPSQSLSKFDQKLFARATLHQQKGQIDSAIVLWNKFLQRNPSSFEVRNNLGLLYYANDEIVKAIYHYDQGLKLRPREDRLKMNLVRALKVQSAILEENRQYDEAIVSLNRIVQLSPTKEQEAIERQIEALEDQIFQQVKKSDSMGEYQEFLKIYPRSPGNSDEARLWIENKLKAKKMGNQGSLSSDFQPSLASESR